LFYIAVVLLALIILFYWVSRSVVTGKRRVTPSIGGILLALGMISLLVLVGELDRWEFSGRAVDQKLAIAIVFDTSLSMHAGPDPNRFPHIKSRLERSKEVVLDILEILDKDRRDAIISVLIFTVRAANILSWNPNLQEVSATIDRTLAVNIIGRGGTDLGGALARSVEVFDALPGRAQANVKKVLLFVSDGERTVNMVDIAESLSQLQQRNITVISLQVGLLDEPEGIREFNESGFAGFWKGAGEMYTVPDVNTMVAIGGRDSRRSFYVRAEDPGASQRILGFLDAGGGLIPRSFTPEQFIILCIWFLSVIMLKRLVA